MRRARGLFVPLVLAARRVPDDLLEAAWLFATLRIVLTVFAIAVWLSAGPPEACAHELTRAGWTTFPPVESDGAGFVLLGQWQRFDACWYAKIATFGYEPGEHSVAFFPLFPTLVAVVGRLTLGNLALAGLIVAAVGYVAAMAGLLRLVTRDFGPRLARRSALYISVFPSAFFLLAPFTESLFLALAVWTISYAREGRWGRVAIVGLLAGLTRPHGVLLVLPIAWELFRQWRDCARESMARTSNSVHRPGVSAVGMGLAAMVAPAIAFAAFSIFAAATTGESPLEAQQHWSADLRLPWQVLTASFDYAVDRRNLVQAANLVTVVVAVAVVTVAAFRLPIAYTLYAAPQVALVATRLQDPQPLMSTMRYVLAAFPLFVAVAMMGEYRRFHASWLIASLIFLGYFTYLFLTGHFVG